MPEETSISDLLPLVAVALSDKAAADATRELATAREERDIPRKVEVIRCLDNGEDEDEDDEAVVFASALFEDGQYAGNTNLWDVTLEQNSNNTCRLADLRDCHICVGGGFPVATLDDEFRNDAGFQGWVDGEDSETTGDACAVSFCFSPYSMWLGVLIHGWPREEWEAFIQADSYHPDDVCHHLVDIIAAQHPEATVEFKKVSFVAKHIHGALKRLLPPKRKEEVRADRDRRIAEYDNPEFDALYHFVARTMRERGNEANAALFVPQLQSIMGFLGATGVNRLGVNDELITAAVEAHERHGEEGLQEFYNQNQLGQDQDDEDESMEQDGDDEEENGEQDGDAEEVSEEEDGDVDEESEEG